MAEEEYLRADEELRKKLPRGVAFGTRGSHPCNLGQNGSLHIATVGSDLGAHWRDEIGGTLCDRNHVRLFWKQELQ